MKRKNRWSMKTERGISASKRKEDTKGENTLVDTESKS
jgi:hypothetical protein